MQIGKYIKYKRLSKNITQTELCTGICSISTLSRIEGGKNVPTFFVKKAIFEKLDIEDDPFIIYASKSSLLFQEKINSITTLILKNKFQEAKNQLEELKIFVDSEVHLELNEYNLVEQSIKIIEIILKIYLEKDDSKITQDIYYAISLTNQLDDFNEKSILTFINKILTFNEIILICIYLYYEQSSISKKQNLELEYKQNFITNKQLLVTESELYFEDNNKQNFVTDNKMEDNNKEDFITDNKMENSNFHNLYLLHKLYDIIKSRYSLSEQKNKSLLITQYLILKIELKYEDYATAISICDNCFDLTQKYGYTILSPRFLFFKAIALDKLNYDKEYVKTYVEKALSGFQFLDDQTYIKKAENFLKTFNDFI
jgi:transcriptional regulator with XRE-family HTH domain